MKLTDTLHFRLFLSFSAALLLAAVSAWWIASTLLASSLEQHISKQLEHTATVLSEGNFPFTPDLLKRLSRVINAEIFLIQQDGKPGPSTLLEDEPALQQLLLTQFRNWQQQRDNPQYSTNLDYDGQPYQLVFHAITRERDPRYIAVATLTSLAAVHQASRQVALWLGAAALAGLALLAWAGHHIARRFTVPVRELATMASRIAGGSRDVRATIHHADEVGELAQALNTMADKLQFYEQEMAEKTRLATIGEMATRIAHEIRNPLTAIKLQAQLMQESAPPAQQPVLRKLLDEISRLELIVTSTLDVARPVSLNTKPTDLNDLVTSVSTLLGPQLQHRGIETVLDLDPELPSLQLDSDRIKQVLLNLILNAADELAKGGKIVIHSLIRRDRDGIELIIEDSGAGIPEHLYKEIFKPMQSGKTGGLGLGLTVSKELVELHGGHIHVSQGSLGGAGFYIFLPARRDRDG